MYYRPDIADLVKLFMVELRLTVVSPDYTRAIEFALAKRQRDLDDDEAIMLLM